MSGTGYKIVNKTDKISAFLGWGEDTGRDTGVLSRTGRGTKGGRAGERLQSVVREGSLGQRGEARHWKDRKAGIGLSSEDSGPTSWQINICLIDERKNECPQTRAVLGALSYFISTATPQI